MADSPSSIPIGVRCPRCGNKDERPLGWLRERTQIFCPACGAAIAINQEKLTAFLRKATQDAAAQESTPSAAPAQPIKQRAPRIGREVKFLAGFAVVVGSLIGLAWLGAERQPGAPRPCGLSDQEVFGGAAGTQHAAPTASAPPVPVCANRPGNGDVLGMWITPVGRHVLEMRNQTGGDMIVKIRDAGTDRAIASFFVLANTRAALGGLPDGTYRIRYELGTRLAPDCRSFIDPYAVKIVRGTTAMTTEHRADGSLHWEDPVLTLLREPSRDANVDTDTISIDEFNKD